jgi:predicted RNase H-like HicB family nuclease
MASKSVAQMSETRRILKRPYARAIFPDDDGSYYGEIIEFPGCLSSGTTAAEALSNLEEVAESWLRIELEKGHAIPQPLGSSDYSGKLVLRIARGLHRKAAWAAERDGVSLNQFIATCLAECVGERRATPVTTVSMVAVANSARSDQWTAFSNIPTNFPTAFTGEIQLVAKHA